MGREIRRVPLDWEHPVGIDGNYHPMFDHTLEEVQVKWDEGNKVFNALGPYFNWCEYGEIASKDEISKFEGKKYILCSKDDSKNYRDWHGPRPHEPAYYRQEWEEEPTGYCIYETVTEGTPVSPVFASLDEMKDWLVRQGLDEEAANNFCKTGFVPSIVIRDGVATIGLGLESL